MLQVSVGSIQTTTQGLLQSSLDHHRVTATLQMDWWVRNSGLRAQHAAKAAGGKIGPTAPPAAHGLHDFVLNGYVANEQIPIR